MKSSYLFLVIILSFSGCSFLSPQVPSSITSQLDVSPNIHQMIVVYPNPKGSIVLATLERNGAVEAFKSILGPIPANIGRSGFAEPNEKKEGDGKTPSGRYKIYRSFGYEPFIQTRLEYDQVGVEDFWVDDPTSSQYNQWVKGTPQAKSYETLKRSDDQYKYAAVIEYNTDPIVAGNGSAIFLHVWKAKGKSTAGCVSVSEKNMKKLLQWLDKNKNPYIWMNPNYEK